MNSYTINGNLGEASVIRSEMSSLLLYAFMFGESLRVSGNSFSGCVIDFQLPFSLSNLNADEEVLYQGMYDTNCQQVFEFVDKPYAVKGYLACAIFTSANQGLAAKDFDNYRKVWLRADAGAVYTAFIGTVNSTHTDFYEPFSDAEYVTYMDVASSLTSYMKQSQISAKAIGRGLQQELNPGSTSSGGVDSFVSGPKPSLTADSFVSARAETKPRMLILK